MEFARLYGKDLVDACRNIAGHQRLHVKKALDATQKKIITNFRGKQNTEKKQINYHNNL